MDAESYLEGCGFVVFPWFLCWVLRPCVLLRVIDVMSLIQLLFSIIGSTIL